MRHTRALAVLALVAAVTPLASQSRRALTAPLSARFGFGDLQRAVLEAGLDAAEALQTPADDGVAAIGGIWIDAPAAAYLEWADTFADAHRGSARESVRKVSTPPRLSDFDTLVLSKEELRDLSRCRLRDCTMQLDAASIQRIAVIDWRRDDAGARATAIVREMMFDIATRYTDMGDAGLPDFHDSARQTGVARTGVGLLDEEAAAGLAPPDLLAYLRRPPSGEPRGATSYLYWTTHTFGLKPTTRLNHAVVYRGGPEGMAGAIATKMLYASHYFHGGLETRYVMTDASAPDRFLLVDITRLRSDGLTGVTGAVIGDTIRRGAVQALRGYLRFTKRAIEQRVRASTQGQESQP